MTKAAEIKELLRRAEVTADALARPGADRKAEAASLRGYLIRICHILTDIQAEVTVTHEQPVRQPVHRQPDTRFGKELRYFGENLARTVSGIK